jgi:hypothetical protein
LLTSPQVVGSSDSQASPSRRRGAITYVITKLAAIRLPAMLKVHILCRDKLTSQGAAESSDATAVPIPSKTSMDGNAQQIKVLKELKREK